MSMKHLPVIFLILQAMALAVSGHHDVCKTTKCECQLHGGECQSFAEICEGKILRGRGHCSNFKHCGCCVPTIVLPTPQPVVPEEASQCISDSNETSVLWKKIDSAETALLAVEAAINASVIAITASIDEGNNVTKAASQCIGDSNETSVLWKRIISASVTAITGTIDEGNNVTSNLIDNLEDEIQSVKQNLDDLVARLDQTTPAPLTCPISTCAPCPTTGQTTSALLTSNIATCAPCPTTDQTTPAPSTCPNSTCAPCPTTDQTTSALPTSTIVTSAPCPTTANNQCEAEGKNNSILWNKISTSENAIITTVSKGNDDVTSALKKDIHNLEVELKKDNHNLEVELKAVENNQDIANSKLDSLIDHCEGTNNQCEAEGKNNSIIWNKVATSENSIITTVSKGNDDVTSALKKDIHNLEVELKKDNHNLEVELQSVKQNLDYLVARLDLQDVNFANSGGTAYATSNHHQSHSANVAFLGGGNGFWASVNKNFPQSLWFQFPKPIRVVKYSFMSREGGLAGPDGASKYIFWSSNHGDCRDESQWVILYEDYSGTPFTENVPKIEYINNLHYFKCYGFKVIDVQGRDNGDKYVTIRNVHFYERGL